MKSILTKVIILILAITMIYIPNTSYAMDDVINSGDAFLSAGGDSPIDEEALKTTSNTIYNVLLTIAIVLAIAIGMIIGIQFIIGGAEEQAKVKETLIPYVIGVFVVFAAFTIWKLAVSIGNDVVPTPSQSTQQRPNTIHECPYCGKSLMSGQQQDIERKGYTKCRDEACGKTIYGTSSQTHLSSDNTTHGGTTGSF